MVPALLDRVRFIIAISVGGCSVGGIFAARPLDLAATRIRIADQQTTACEADGSCKPLPLMSAVPPALVKTAGAQSGSQDGPNTSLSYVSCEWDTRTLTIRTWTSILRAVQHPTYTAPLLKSTLLARIQQLQNCADAYPLRNVAPATLGTSVTINGAPHDITSTQRDLASKLAKELQINSTEASKAVLQQARLGIVDIEGVEKAYMAERTNLLRVVKILLSLDVNGSENTDMVDIAREIVKQIKGKNDFVTKLVEALRKRVEESLPAKAIANIHSSLVWSRQVRLPGHMG